MTATKTKAPNAGRTWADIEAAIIRRIEESPEPGDYELLAVAGIVDDRLKVETTRLARMLNEKKRLQSVQELTDAEAHLAECKPRCEAEIEALEEQLRQTTAAISAEIEERKREVTRATQDVDAKRDARSRLRQLVPEHVRQQHSAKWRDPKFVEFREAVAKQRGEVNFLQSVCDLQNDRESAGAMLRWPPSHPFHIDCPKHLDNWERVMFAHQCLPQIQRTAAERLPAAREAADRLDAELREREQELNRLLDYYLEASPRE